MKKKRIRSAEYGAWTNMKHMCTNEKHANFKYYGGRGIKVCNRWKNSYENFLNDVGKRPGKGYSLERIDNNGDYTPDNCKWATQKEQMQNTRRNIIISFDNKTMCLKEWSRKLKINYKTLQHRINAGWPVKEAFKN